MGSYVVSSKEEQKEMLEALSLESVSALFSDVPASLSHTLRLPHGMSELETEEKMTALAAKNTVFHSIFRGAGAYDHYIPAAVREITAKEEFVTAYTPYQAELSQGVLQSIFEYQTMICALCGMEVSNASVYDGACAAAEAAAMCKDRSRKTILISAACHPDVLETVKSYCFASDTPLSVIPEKDGKTDAAALSSLLSAEVAGVIFAQPAFSGILEDAEALVERIHAAGALAVMSINPIAAALLKTPGECGADIAVGEGQPLGLPLSFGGPYLGFMATKQSFMRKLPGRIVGETVDRDGRRAYVLTLQAREQHIKREKAASSICSNEALCALTASVYLSCMGAGGLSDCAKLCYSKAHYAAKELCKIPGISLLYPGDFFHEFVTVCPVSAKKIETALQEAGILSGLPLSENTLLWCTTERCTKEKIDAMVQAVKEACEA